MNKKTTERKISQSGTFSAADIEPLLKRDQAASQTEQSPTPRKVSDRAATGVMPIVSEDIDENGPFETDNPRGQT